MNDAFHDKLENLADKLNGPIDLEKIELLGVAPTVWDKALGRTDAVMHYPRQSGKNELLSDMLRKLQRVVAEDDGDTARTEYRCIMPPLGCGRPLSETCDHSRCLEGQYFHTGAASREYLLTGMCQACQDRFFAKPENNQVDYKLGCDNDEDPRPVHPNCASDTENCGCGRP